MAKRAKDLQLILHVGLHKTASTYIQNVLSARRYDLIQDGVLYPSAGMVVDDRTRTRDGAQSGHFRLTFRNGRRALITQLLNETPVNVSTVLLSAEDFTHPRLTPDFHVEQFSGFGSIKVVVVLRRQDVWIESFYKQQVDQYGSYETRSFPEFLLQEGPSLLDFYDRLSPWRELVGPENFIALSYDDLAGGDDICRRILEVAGVPADRLATFPGVEVPGYGSIRGIDTVGLRILNGFRIPDPDVRNKIARDIYDAAPVGDLQLLTPQISAAIQARYAEVNERIEAEWFTEPVPGFRFGAELRPFSAEPPSGPEMLDYVDQVVALCGEGRARCDVGTVALTGADGADLPEAAPATPAGAGTGETVPAVKVVAE